MKVDGPNQALILTHTPNEQAAPGHIVRSC
jgi:hypothetical protein